jgi:hypothetical protein
MKLIICIFEKLPRLKVNFHESEIYCFGLKKITIGISLGVKLELPLSSI